MKDVFRKIFNIFLSGVLACIGVLPFWSIPVLADTTYYSFNQFTASTDGNTLYGLNLSISPVNFVIANINESTSQKYNVIYYAYALGSSANNATGNLKTNLGVSDLSSVTGIRYEGSPGSFTYSSPVSFTSYSGSFRDVDDNLKYFACVYLSINPNITMLSCYAKTGSLMVSSSNTVIQNYVLNAIRLANNANLMSGFSASSFAGGWVKDSTAITPVYTLPNGDGVIEGEEPDPTPTPTADPEGGDGGDSGSGSSSFSSQQQQQQYQTIAEGAVAFTIADGAFSNSQTQTQSIEENAVNVTVNNNNALTQENYQELNSLINNYNGTSSDENDPFQQAIGNFQAFHAIALAFAGLASIVFGWLPWWVTALLGAMFSMVCVFIVLRLIHLFK